MRKRHAIVPGATRMMSSLQPAPRSFTGFTGSFKRVTLFIIFLLCSCALPLHAFMDRDVAAKHAAAGCWTEAKKVLERALADDPDDPELLHDLGVASFRDGDTQQACSYFERAKQMNGLDTARAVEAGYNHARTQVELGQLEDAVQSYEQVLEKDPTNEKAHNDLAIVKRMLDQKNQQQQNNQDKQDQQKQNQQDQNNSDCPCKDNKQGGSGQQNNQKNDSQDQSGNNGQQGDQNNQDKQSDQDGQQGEQSQNQHSGQSGQSQERDQGNQRNDAGKQGEQQQGDRNQEGKRDQRLQNDRQNTDEMNEEGSQGNSTFDDQRDESGGEHREHESDSSQSGSKEQNGSKERGDQQEEHERERDEQVAQDTNGKEGDNERDDVDDHDWSPSNRDTKRGQSNRQESKSQAMGPIRATDMQIDETENQAQAEPNIGNEKVAALLKRCDKADQKAYKRLMRATVGKGEGNDGQNCW